MIDQQKTFHFGVYDRLDAFRGAPPCPGRDPSGNQRRKSRISILVIIQSVIQQNPEISCADVLKARERAYQSLFS